MCLLIVQKKNNRVTEQQFRNAWSRNDDGVGYSFVNEDEFGFRKIETKKYLNDDGFEQFLTDYKNDVKTFGNRSVFLIHFRYTTHGKSNLENCHPFKVSDDLAFGHNGVINGVDDGGDKSDTAVFNESILQKLPSNWFDNESIVKLVESFIGHSKLAFLNVDGSFKIIKEKLGHWINDGGIWMSNGAYKREETFCHIPTGYTFNDGKSVQYIKPNRIVNRQFTWKNKK